MTTEAAVARSTAVVQEIDGRGGKIDPTVADIGAPVGLRVAAGAVLVVAAVTLDLVATTGTAAIGFAVFGGFLVDRLGELSWHGAADVWRLTALVVAAAVGLASGEVFRLVRR